MLSEEGPLSFQPAPSTPGHSWAVSHQLFTEPGSHSHRRRPRPPPVGKGRAGGLRWTKQTLRDLPAWLGLQRLPKDASPGDLPTVMSPGRAPRAQDPCPPGQVCWGRPQAPRLPTLSPPGPGPGRGALAETGSAAWLGFPRGLTSGGFTQSLGPHPTKRSQGARSQPLTQAGGDRASLLCGSWFSLLRTAGLGTKGPAPSVLSWAALVTLGDTPCPGRPAQGLYQDPSQGKGLSPRQAGASQPCPLSRPPQTRARQRSASTH